MPNEKRERMVQRSLDALKVSPDVRTCLKDIYEEIEAAYEDRFAAGKGAIQAYLDTLPRCGAEDMGGWPACSRTGSYGPSNEHLQQQAQHADTNVYCDWHAKDSFRGRPLTASTELPYAALVRFMFEEGRRVEFGGMPVETYPTVDAYLAALDRCFAEHGDDVVEAERFDADPDHACWTCMKMHRAGR